MTGISLAGSGAWWGLAVLAVLAVQVAILGGLRAWDRSWRRAQDRVQELEAELRASRDRLHDLGSRLLGAQDAERARIARELHDDISQQVALLAIELRQEGGSAEAQTRVGDIARSLHELSHRLHPARLRLLGLVESLRALQHEHIRAGLSVVFIAEDVPGLSPELTLCLYRVVQEALRNADTHGRAKHATVVLEVVDGELMLSVTDDGAGFDVKSAWGRGLGLISMKERVEAHGSTFVIDSEPGGGTHLKVAVPLSGKTAAVGSPRTERRALRRRAAARGAATRRSTRAH